MKKTAEEIKNLFDSWARVAPPDFGEKQWLLSKWENSQGVDWPKEKIACMLRHISVALNVQSTHVLADLGCGGGWITQALCSSVQKIIGVDFAFAMLKHARRLYPEAKFICGDIAQIPLKDNSFDRVLCYFVFINMMDDALVEQALNEMARILRKGGRALVGQLPDQSRSSDYDKAKKRYLEYWDKTGKIGQDYRDVCRVPQKLFDRDRLTRFLESRRISHHFRKSFNPFYRKGEPETVEWRFDLVLEKDY